MSTIRQQCNALLNTHGVRVPIYWGSVYPRRTKRDRPRRTQPLVHAWFRNPANQRWVCVCEKGVPDYDERWTEPYYTKMPTNHSCGACANRVGMAVGELDRRGGVDLVSMLASIANRYPYAIPMSELRNRHAMLENPKLRALIFERFKGTGIFYRMTRPGYGEKLLAGASLRKVFGLGKLSMRA